MKARAFAAAGMAAAMLAAGGCSRLQVSSQPAGAKVLWSADGVSNWQPWPPRSWSADGDADSEAKAPVTPLRDSGVFGDTVWITVEKEGYYRPLPKAAQLYALRSEKFAFDLVETPEAYARRRTAEGFVLWRGEWVKPADHDLAQFAGVWMTREEAFEREQLAAGMVKYAGEWMTPAQAAVRHADEQRAKGLVEFKNRWVAPAEKMREEAVDAEVAALAATDPDALALPRLIGPVEGAVSQVQILNSTSKSIRLLLSGPESREFVLLPYSSFGLSNEERLRVAPGRYQIAVIPQSGLEATEESSEAVRRIASDAAYRPLYLEAAFAEGFQYLLNYDVESDFGEGDIEEYRRTEIELPIEAPTIEIPEIELPQERPRRGGFGGNRPGGAPGATPGAGQAPADGQRRQRPEGGTGGQQPRQGQSTPPASGSGSAN